MHQSSIDQETMGTLKKQLDSCISQNHKSKPAIIEKCNPLHIMFSNLKGVKSGI